MMTSLLKFFLFCIMLIYPAQSGAEEIDFNSTGIRNGYFYTYWRDGGSATLVLNPDRSFDVDWKVSNNNFVGGVGWKPGSSTRKIVYNASAWSPRGTAYLTLYGWTRNPLVEYYVVDSWGSWRPPGATSVGTVTTDGGTYNLYRTKRVNKPSIDGTRTFDQYWSVRTKKRRIGRNQTITFANHVKAWASKGWQLGRHDYQVVAIEGYHSTGRSSVKVWEE